jgi:hypothetical protein
MALSFANTSGKAVSSNAYKYKDGQNSLRLFGGIMAIYGYWLKTAEGKPIYLECLSFDREKEKFTNVEKDWVQHYFPDSKCAWGYNIMALDTTDNKVYTLPLKKKLFAQIQEAAKDLGDPTDLDNGWTVVFTKAKTGSQAFNVEYTLNVLRCKKEPVTDEQREAIEAAPSIDELLPRRTPDEIKQIIETRILGTGDVPPEAQESADDLAF